MMKRLLALPFCFAIACTEVADEPTLGETESASTPIQGQGTYYNGTYYNGTYYNGTYYNGTYYNGTYYNGTTYGGTAMPDAASVTNTALATWEHVAPYVAKQNRPPVEWEQHLPNKICHWDATRTQQVGCTTSNLSTAPSPLTGTAFPATFDKPDGAGGFVTVNGTIYIGGTSTTTLGAVVADTTMAMHSLTGASSAALILYNQYDAYGSRCDNPNGCRVNSDIWLYDLKLWDPTTSTMINFCPNGERATALSGTYDRTGKLTASGTQFTFACTNGTIEKCVRWGYRPFGSSRKFCNQPGGNCPADNNLYPMADYHQACVRAATADYCATGYSFTKNGTLVDIYDYDPSKYDYGFIPKTRGGTVLSIDATAFVWESGFDKNGATQIDHQRYQELAAGTNTVDQQCPGKFYYATGDVLCPQNSGTCEARTGGWGSPVVWVDSTPACSHSEFLVGKWLHHSCSTCAAKVPAYCSSPTDSRGWDAACVASAKSVCTPTQMMSTHGECTTGANLTLFDSGCTLAVCLDPAYASCCSPGSASWTSTCSNAANSKCGFAKKTSGGILLGICASQPVTSGTF